eukprot:snap_masked-scaffold_3-processed-gene-4.9-mRNA-1 protein AED:1.00 eAED:1.00 QI:0/0/0/0/1/1/3/0/301
MDKAESILSLAYRFEKTTFTKRQIVTVFATLTNHIYLKELWYLCIGFIVRMELEDLIYADIISSGQLLDEFLEENPYVTTCSLNGEAMWGLFGEQGEGPPSGHSLELNRTPRALISTMKERYLSELRRNYGQAQVLSESQHVLLGDRRCGNTSLVRTLSRKRFLNYVPSIVVLNDINILELDETTGDSKSITKYELGIQRVKNVLAQRVNEELEEVSTSGYNLHFESELIDRVLEDQSVHSYHEFRSDDFKSKSIFLHVLDFGGQDIFSSVHHIFISQRAVFVLVFNLMKLKEQDLARLKL